MVPLEDSPQDGLSNGEGKTIDLRPGQTFVELLATGETVSVSAPK